MKKILTLLPLIPMLFGCGNSTGESGGKNIYSHRVGGFTVTLLSEGQQTIAPEILIGLTDQMMESYVPDGVIPNAVNAFLVQTPASNILIDTGYGTRLVENLEEVGLAAGDIDIILLTHLHGDHIGGLLDEGEVVFPDAEIYIPAGEFYYWTDEQIMESQPTGSQKSFRNVIETAEKYENRLYIFEPSYEFDDPAWLFDGIGAIAAPGHTPGHTMYMIASEEDRLLIWADLTHAMAIQMPWPEVAATYDIAPGQAVESRFSVLRYVTAYDIPIAGMHISYPGMGRVTNDGGGYKFSPFK